jgi:ABC-2 type transport system permease protein
VTPPPTTAERPEQRPAAPAADDPYHGAPHGTARDELHRAVALTWTLGLTDWRLRFYGSALGYLWTLVRPFAFFGVIYFVFTEIAKLGTDVPHYASYILISMVLFNFFAEITNNAVISLPARENLLRKMHFPAIVIPLAVVVTGLLTLAGTLVAVIIFAFINGVTLHWGWLELPVLIGLLLTLGLGVGMLLSALYLRFRDVQPIWEVIAQILFYASPILYVATNVPGAYYQAYLCNPIAAIFTQMRHAVIDPTAPSIFTALPDGKWLIPLGLILGTFALGLWVFRRESPRVAENL